MRLLRQDDRRSKHRAMTLLLHSLIFLRPGVMAAMQNVHLVRCLTLCPYVCACASIIIAAAGGGNMRRHVVAVRCAWNMPACRVLVPVSSDCKRITASNSNLRAGNSAHCGNGRPPPSCGCRRRHRRRRRRHCCCHRRPPEPCLCLPFLPDRAECVRTQSISVDDLIYLLNYVAYYLSVIDLPRVGTRTTLTERSGCSIIVGVYVCVCVRNGGRAFVMGVQDQSVVEWSGFTAQWAAPKCPVPFCQAIVV